MNNIWIKIYKNLLKEMCDEYNGAEDFVNEKTEQICSHEEVVICWRSNLFQSLYFLVSFLSIKKISRYEV